MRVIIAGSRTIIDYDIVKEAIKDSKFKITSIVSSMANGVYKLGALYAKNNNIHCENYLADWKKHKKAAGHIRNTEMAENADALILIWMDIALVVKICYILLEKKD